MERKEFNEMRDELLTIFTPQELVRMVNLVFNDGNIELMREEVRKASREGDLLNKELNAKLEKLSGGLPREKLKKVSAYVYAHIGGSETIYDYIPLKKED